MPLRITVCTAAMNTCHTVVLAHPLEHEQHRSPRRPLRHEAMRSTSSREEQFPGAHELGAEWALQRNAEKAYSFQLTGTRKGPCVNRTQAARFDQLGDRGLRCCVVTGDEDIERLTGHRPGDQRSGEGGIE